MAILTNRVRLKTGDEIEGKRRVDFPIDAKDKWEAFEKFDAELQPIIDQLQEDADKRIARSKIAIATQGDLDRLDGQRDNALALRT